ncbi:hypothetical protein OAT67_02850 [Bacteriovoracaceae bacterium]|nr:hypothetical protein [Bacteriovoracaceae bacterium]|tara:strand:+ start:69481 stop:70146 length:666 start_codon:yes stop_codon:yes gene_type:complete
MKKLIPVIIVLAVSIFFLLNRETTKFTEYEDDSTSSQESDTKKVSTQTQNKIESHARESTDPVPTVVEETDITKKDILTAEGSIGEKQLTEEEMEELDEYFDKVEEEWDRKIKDLFITEMGLSSQDVEDYNKMKEGFAEDKIEIYQDYHEEMVQKYGDSYQFKPSEEMTSFEKKLREDYQNLIRKRIGDDNFKKYIEMLDNYNEEVRREQNPQLPALYIEL